LPDADGVEALKGLFGKFRDTMNVKAGNVLKDNLAGSTPGGRKPDLSNANTGDETEDFVYSKMLETAGRDDKAFVTWQQKYDAILAKKKS
jgi:hypothetical protein